MIIDLVKKGEKRKIELECIFEGKLEFPSELGVREVTRETYFLELAKAEAEKRAPSGSRLLLFFLSISWL